MKNKNIIIGSGPAGLGVALGLEKDFTLLEKTDQPGGFSMSIEIDGAVFDFGGHSFHTPHPEVKDLVFNSLEMFEQKRNAKCLSDGKIIDYPFQKSFRQLENQALIEACLKGLENADSGEGAPNFEEYINRRFGTGISDHFMLPYNRKLWGRNLTRLAADWTGQRVAAPEGVKENFDTKGGVRKPLQANTAVAYPAKGGFGEIFKALAKQVEGIQLNKHVERIDLKGKKIYTAGGEVWEYDKLVSTMPITILLSLIEGVPVALINRVHTLDNLSLKLGLIVIDHPVDTDIQRIYSAEEHIAPHKTAVNHNSSDYLRSLPRHGIMMEISEGPEKKLVRADLENWMRDNLLEMRLIKSVDEIKNITVVDAKYAYPVPTHDRDEIVDEIQAWLNEYDVYSTGRFGQWAYINSDEALNRGIALGRKLAAE